MARPSAARAVDVAQRLRASNRRVAWTLASIAAVFFAGIIATRWLGGGTAGIGTMGAAVLLFLVIAIGRNLRRTDEPAGGSAERNDAVASAEARPRDAADAASEAGR